MVLISDSDAPSLANSVAIPILKLWDLKWPGAPIKSKDFCNTDWNWYFGLEFKCVTKLGVWDKFSLRPKQLLMVSIWLIDDVGCGVMSTTEEIPIWSVFDFCILIWMSRLALILMSLHCKANVSLTLNKPKYVRVKAAENNADSYAYKPKRNF